MRRKIAVSEGLDQEILAAKVQLRGGHMLSMALRQLPARIRVEDVQKLLGFTGEDTTILMGDPKLDLKPLGCPAQNAPKFFATARVLKLANNLEWLNKASDAVRKHHLKKRRHAAGVGQHAKTSSTETSTNDVGGTARLR